MVDFKKKIIKGQYFFKVCIFIYINIYMYYNIYSDIVMIRIN